MLSFAKKTLKIKNHQISKRGFVYSKVNKSWNGSRFFFFVFVRTFAFPPFIDVVSSNLFESNALTNEPKISSLGRFDLSLVLSMDFGAGIAGQLFLFVVSFCCMLLVLFDWVLFILSLKAVYSVHVNVSFA